ncbi:class I SAM-dependent methyltransferase [Okeania sp.]|uniref:class I SAM-dependent methyltransferase n=1 Tax=Okeania sp. TaxID=3100323 RepID=UPI002B4ABECC|nr:class I SAM-dependent methyltransferase [Okeania sp.]MEB3339204.1 class I SAM-dependent methyltransferase [Okeania sp.]
MNVTSDDIKAVYEESNATQHYLSPNRKDNVKVYWEEAFSRFVFKQAILSIDTPAREKLRVLDVGAGIGDGYTLLSDLLAQEPSLDKCNLDYLGIDISPEMVETANNLYKNNTNVRFEQADIRKQIPESPFDLYLSCGVPYSHLTHEELETVLKILFERILKNQSPCAVVIDVLGRYSIEWQPHWSESRWNYNMSFFKSEGEAKPTLMSFYSHEHLEKIIRNAASEVNCPIKNLAFFDRSIVVGRHTSTGAFNRELPKYRNLVNSLLDPNQETDLNQLILRVESGDAPEYIIKFFHQFSGWWNTIIAEAAELLNESLEVNRVQLPANIESLDVLIKQNLANSVLTNDRQRIELAVAKRLQQLEQTCEPGYGVGHDLFGVVWLDTRNS